MFFTEPKSMCRTRPATTTSLQPGTINFIQDQFALAQKRYKQTRQKARDIQRMYTSALSTVNHFKKSIQTTKHKTCQKRLSFIKTFQAKKIKLKQFELEEQNKITQNTYAHNKRKDTKIRKLNNQLQMMVNRNEMQSRNQNLRQKNKTQKLVRKSKFFNVKMMEQVQAKQRYEKIRESKLLLKDKKRQMEDLISLRARHSYLNKINKQKCLIQSYDNLLQQIGGFDKILGTIQNQDHTKEFFLTQK